LRAKRVRTDVALGVLGIQSEEFMPRRQRFKPSRKPKPAIEMSENEIIQPSEGKPTIDQESREMNVGQRGDLQAERHPPPDEIEDRVPR
jgi:hypothetical protein